LQMNNPISPSPDGGRPGGGSVSIAFIPLYKEVAWSLSLSG